MNLETEVRAPEKVSAYLRATPDYRVRKVCYCCGTTKTVGPHHIIPREEGGLPIFDNIVWLCVPCHDAVEGPAHGARERIEARRFEARGATKPVTDAFSGYDPDKPCGGCGWYLCSFCRTRPQTRPAEVTRLARHQAPPASPVKFIAADPTKCGDCGSPINPNNCAAFADKYRCDRCANKIYAARGARCARGVAA